jgi:CHAT domain-containing protein
LDKASQLAPNDARLLSDLAAAFLARAREKDDPHDFVLALATADKAVTVNRQLPEAQFNRAVALERLFLFIPAKSAWEDYLQLDSVSDWAREGRARHAALSEPTLAAAWDEQEKLLDYPETSQDTVEKIGRQFPQETRQYVEETILGSWGDQILKREAQNALRTLANARRAADLLIRLHEEYMPADAVAAIDRALSAGDLATVTALAEGHRAYRDGRILDKQFRGPEARPLFEEARRAFARGRSPAEALASLYLAIGYYQEFRYGRAVQILDGFVPAEARSERHPGLLGRAYWLIGLMHVGDGEPEMSLLAYRIALSAMQKTGGAEGIAGVHAVLAENFRYLGRWRETWWHLYQALTATPRIQSSRRLGAILTELADACEATGEWSVASYFREEAVRVAEGAGEPGSLAQALLRSSQTLMQAGKEPEAEARLMEARQALERIPDATLRERTEADLLIAESTIHTVDFRDTLTEALAFYEGKDNHFLVSRLLLARARSGILMGEEGAAEQDLRRAIQEYELQRSRVGEEALQISFFDQAESLYAEMIRLQAIHFGRAGAALDFAERSRARALLDRVGPITQERKREILAGTVEPLTSEELGQRLPEGMAILEYALLKDRLLVWVIRRNGLHLEEGSAGFLVMDALVNRLRNAIAERSPNEVLAAASSLYDLLIRPVLSHLEPQDRLVFIPDKSLHSIPFAALFDRIDRKYLVENYVISVAPSATLALHAVTRQLKLELEETGRMPTALVVGNPAFRKDLVPLLDLPQAEREAEEIKNLFPGSEALIREEATRSRFLDAAGDYEIIHFGGHAVVNQEFPLLSYLVLSPENPKESGLLYGHELYSGHFERSQLAVLAACETASGPISGEGVMSLARAFLAVGVPNVVASLWDIEDQMATQLLRAFYARLTRVSDPVVALRDAQLSLLRSSNSNLRDPAAWAAFELFGGV